MRKLSTLRSSFHARIALITLTLAFLHTGVRAQVAAWELDGNAGNEVTVAATTTASNVTVGPLSRGSGINATSLNNAFAANGFDATTMATAVSLNEFFQFSIAPQAGHQASLSTLNANFRRSNTGPNAFQWRYSLDGFSTAGVDIGSTISYTNTATNGSAQAQIDLSTIAALQNIQPGTTVTFRLYAWGASAGTGTFALGRLAGNDLAVGGTVTPVASNTTVQFAQATQSVSEAAGTVDVTVSITSPSATQATSLLVALTSGDNSLVDGFTSQTITFPAGSSTPQTITLTLVDNSTCDGNAVLSFGMENVTGGDAATVGQPSTQTLTIVDNDQVQDVQLARQFFDGGGNESWSIVTGGANISTTQGTGDTPPNQRILSPAASWQVNNATATLELGTVFLNNASDLSIRARVASLSTTTGNGHELDDQVQFFANVNGGGFPATADITITGVGLGASAGNARWGYATGTGVASTTAGTPVTFTPSSGGNQTSEGYSYVVIYLPAGTESVELRVIATNDAAGEVWAIDNVELHGNTCPRNYYSEASGNMTDPIWSPFPGGTPGPALINEAANIIVQSGFTVTNTTNNSVNNITVASGGVLVLNSGFGLTAYGNSVSIEGTLTANQGTLALAGSSATTLSATAPLQLHDLTVNTPAGTAAQGIINIKGSLRLQQGVFDANGATVTLVSDADGTGRLGVVQSGASYSGDITQQRYIPGGATNWRLLGSPVEGATVAQWMDDFITAGFPGSHFPEFFDPPGVYWPSIRWYDETVPGSDVNDGLLGVESSATTLAAGRGYAVWSGDSLGGTAPFTVDVTGVPRVAQNPLNLPVTWTDSGNPSVDGFNLVSNPLPSAIDFTAIDRGADVQNLYYVYNPATGNNEAWAMGIGQGTADGIIRSSQGFWLKAIGPATTTTVLESDKVAAPAGGSFGGLEQVNVPIVSLKISSALNPYSDEALIVFGMGTPGLDEMDVPKLVYAHPDAPQIALRNGSDQDMHMEFHGVHDAGITIPVTADVAVSGTYTINATMLGMSGLSCFSLEDLHTGITTPLNNGGSYSFQIDADDDAATPRFLLHATTPLAFGVTDVLCSGDATGAAAVTIADGVADIHWTDPFGATIDLVENATGTVTLDGLTAGTYMVTVSGTGTGCGSLVQEFEVAAPFELEAAVLDVVEATCAGTPDGGITVMTMGGVAPYEHLWSNGANTESIEAAPGVYTVTITDANGCTWTSEEIGIPLIESAPVAAFTAPAGILEVGQPVSFINTSTNASTHFWDLGDGSFSEEAEPTHSYATPGTYTVTLTVESADGCASTYTTDIIIQLGTSIATVETTGVHAWSTGDHFVVEHAFNNGTPVSIELLDATGRLHLMETGSGMPGRVRIPVATLASGVYFVRITNRGAQHTLRVPHTR